MGDYPFDLSPSEFARRNVRITPLPRLHQSPVALLDRYPECVTFSSDFNHNEGSGTPTAYYRDLLEGLAPAVVAGFMGDNVAERYARMGDPLPGGRDHGNERKAGTWSEVPGIEPRSSTSSKRPI